MKKNISIFLFTLALSLSLLLSGCDQASTTTQPPESDTTATTPVEGANVQTDEPKVSEDAQPSDTGTLANEPDPSEGIQGNETDSPAENTPENSPNVSEGPTATPEQTSTPEQQPTSAPTSTPTPTPTPTPTSTPTPTPTPTPAATSDTTLSGKELTLRFGGGGVFTIHLYDNDTANKIAEYVGTAAWQLPIYHFDDYEGWEFFQYYDIPSRYNIPDGSGPVTFEKAGAVYYSHPNRIILFYQDANISTEYTPVGYVDFSQALVDAVENNPVVPGWGNKLIFIQP